MSERSSVLRGWLSPLLVGAAALVSWVLLINLRLLPTTIFPSPEQVVRGFGEEWNSRRLVDDTVASLWRVAVGCLLAVGMGIPIGLWLGRKRGARVALMPALNFFRNLSPIAWVGFAVTWFGVGDRPAIFLIFLSAFFPLIVATEGAVATIPQVYFRVAQEYGMSPRETLFRVTLPAILPQLITTLRVTAGIGWVVVVAAEMVAGRDGLGYAVLDDRNGLRQDLLVVHMIVIGMVGVVIDRLLLRLTRLESVRWSYDR